MAEGFISDYKAPRLKIGKTGHWMRSIQSYILTLSTILSVTMERSKLAAYVILGIWKEERGMIHVGENESSKYWLSVLNELKKRHPYQDGLTG